MAEDEFEILALSSRCSTWSSELTTPRSGVEVVVGDASGAAADPAGVPALGAPFVAFDRAGVCRAAIEVGEL